MTRARRARTRLLAAVRRRRAGPVRVHPGTGQEPGLAALLGLLARRRDDVLARGTDWVFALAPDLQGKRPREETENLVDRVITTNVAVLESGDRRPLHTFIDYVTSLRAASEFRVSTLLRGFLSFKRGLAAVIAEERWTAREALGALGLVDEVYYEAIFELSDVYGEKLVGSVVAQKRELEAELGAKRAELDAQHAMLRALSSPILRVWEGVLLLPLVGEISPERAEHAKSVLLHAIGTYQARVVLIDVTGLSVVDAHAAGVLGAMMRATGLVGAEGMLVGVRGDAARTFVEIGELFPGARTFATLGDGLRHAIRRVLHLSKARPF
ncbi:STAS domain-containing protein [Polyangium jinanense]|uniref:STAS domain-containing protein n=1 Tax=Polyangium jinanense TaxID=2829994 RepID=A0A9X3X4X2_9BACT|nr:STAS domain-containing protein [Polyangium jinanense]MDC3961113.1 STAS domain-containing protein [Polyangium jinanense]MDC3982810.1 STAS domain-containing protein [Polyangium jinanense]